MAAPADAPPAPEEEVYPPPPAMAGAHIGSLEDYKRLHAQSLADPAAFWGKLADEFTWKKKWDAEFSR